MQAIGDVVVTLFPSSFDGKYRMSATIKSVSHFELRKEKDYFRGRDFIGDINDQLVDNMHISHPLLLHAVDKVVRAKLDELRTEKYEPCKMYMATPPPFFVYQLSLLHVSK